MTAALTATWTGDPSLGSNILSVSGSGFGASTNYLLVANNGNNTTKNSAGNTTWVGKTIERIVKSDGSGNIAAQSFVLAQDFGVWTVNAYTPVYDTTVVATTSVNTDRTHG